MSIETKPGELRDLNARKVFMIGIGGCSMSGLALLLKSYGYDVSGSTSIDTEYIPALTKQGIRVYAEDNPEDMAGSDLVIYSHAITAENPMVKAARKNGIPLKSRSWLLGRLSGRFDRSISVCGTHGKTTVTSMISQILIDTDQDPTVHIGGIYPPIGGNVRSGKSSLFLTEACEYQRSFLSLHPTGIVLLNIDRDHLDCYRDIDEIEETFGSFLKQLPEDGWVLGCGEDSRVLKLLKSSNCRTFAYGLSDTCDYYMEKPSEDSEGYYQFDFCHNGEKLGHVNMGIPGLFNALNAMSALGAAHILGIDPAAACETISRFRGAHRRFELTGTINGAELIMDYGHNPTEMRNAVSIARKRCKGGRLWAVMQPNNYIRVKTLFQDYLTCTEEADITLVTDIYGYKYQDTGDISSGMLVEGMRRHHVNAVLTPGLSDAAAMIESGVRPGDLVIMMGCGNIHLLNDLLVKKDEEPVQGKELSGK